jgi:hypothetical protein
MSRATLLDGIDLLGFLRSESRSLNNQELTTSEDIVDDEELLNGLRSDRTGEISVGQQIKQYLDVGSLPSGLAFTIKLSNYKEGIRNKFGYVNTMELFELIYTVPLLYHIYKKIDLSNLDDSFYKFKTATEYRHMFEAQYNPRAASRSSDMFASRILSTNPRNERFYVHYWKTENESGYTIYLLNVDRAVMDYVYYHYCKTNKSFIGVLHSYLDYIGVPSDKRSSVSEFMPLMDCLTVANAHIPFQKELDDPEKTQPFLISKFYLLPLEAFTSPCLVQMYVPWEDDGIYFNDLIYDYLRREMISMGATIQENVFTTRCSMETAITKYPPPDIGSLPVAIKITERDGDRLKGIIVIPTRKRKRKTSSSRSKRNTRTRTTNRTRVNTSIDTDDAALVDEAEDGGTEEREDQEEEDDEEKIQYETGRLRGGFWTDMMRNLFREMEKAVKQERVSSIYPAPPVKRLQIFKDPISVFRMMSQELYKKQVIEKGFSGIEYVKEENQRRFDSFIQSMEVRSHLPRGGMKAVFEYSDKKNKIEAFPFHMNGESLLYNAVESLFSLGNNCARANNIIGLFLIGIHQTFICFRIVPMKYHQMITGKHGMGKSHLTELLQQYSIRGLVLLHSQVGSDKVTMTHDPTTYVVEVHAEAGPEFTNGNLHSNENIQQRRANLKNLISSSSVMYSYLEMDKDRRDETSRREEQVVSSIHRCLIVCFNKNEGGEPSVRDRFAVSNHGARVKGADPKSLATAKAADNERPEMLIANTKFSSLIQGAQFLSAAYSLYKNTGCSLIDVFGFEECYTPIARLIIYHVLSKCEEDGIPIATTRDADRILLMACSWTKFRVIADYMRRHEGELLTFGPGHINAKTMRELELKMVTTLDDVIFAISLSPPSLFNPTTRALISHIRSKRFGLDSMVMDFFELRLTRRDADKRKDTSIRDEDLDYIDYTDEEIIIKKLSEILDDPDGELCVRQLNRNGGAASKKPKKKKKTPAMFRGMYASGGGGDGDYDGDAGGMGEETDTLPMVIDPNYIGIKTNLNALAIACVSTMSIQPSKEDIITSIKQLSETMFVPSNYYKNIVLEPDANGKFVIIESTGEGDGGEASIRLEEAEKKPINAVIIDYSHNIIYFAFGALCTNRGVNVLLNMIKREFSYNKTVNRNCVIFDQETLTLKTLELRKNTRRERLRIRLECAKLSRETFIPVYKEILKRNKNANVRNDVWVSMALLGYYDFEDEVNSVAYKDHSDNMHMSSEEALAYKQWVKESYSMNLTEINNTDEIETLLNMALGGKASIEDVWKYRSKELVSQEVIPPCVDPKTLFLPIRKVYMIRPEDDDQMMMMTTMDQEEASSIGHPSKGKGDSGLSSRASLNRRSVTGETSIIRRSSESTEPRMGSRIADQFLQKEIEEAMEELAAGNSPEHQTRSPQKRSSSSSESSSRSDQTGLLLKFGIPDNT